MPILAHMGPYGPIWDPCGAPMGSCAIGVHIDQINNRGGPGPTYCVGLGRQMSPQGIRPDLQVVAHDLGGALKDFC